MTTLPKGWRGSRLPWRPRLPLGWAMSCVPSWMPSARSWRTSVRDSRKSKLPSPRRPLLRSAESGQSGWLKESTVERRAPTHIPKHPAHGHRLRPHSPMAQPPARSTISSPSKGTNIGGCGGLPITPFTTHGRAPTNCRVSHAEDQDGSCDLLCEHVHNIRWVPSQNVGSAQ